MLRNKIKIGIALLLTLFFCCSLSVSSLAKEKRTAKVVVKNNTGEDILNVRVNHKYSDVYKNPLLWEGVLESGATTNPPKSVEYHTGAFTTGRDWWSIIWTQLDDDKVYYSNPTNFRGVFDALEEIGQIAVPIAATGAAAVVGAACTGVSAGACAPAALAGIYTAIGAAGAVSTKMMNDESTVGFKQHILRSEDANQTVTITLLKNGEIEIKSPSGISRTVYTTGKPDVNAETQAYYEDLAEKHLATMNTETNTTFVGTWDTSYGQMTLNVSNGKVSGTYSTDNGRIQGSVAGQTLSGYWIEDNSDQKCSTSKLNSFHWGRIQYKLGANGQIFNGQWIYCDDPITNSSGSWTGKKL